MEKKRKSPALSLTSLNLRNVGFEREMDIVYIFKSTFPIPTSFSSRFQVAVSKQSELEANLFFSKKTHLNRPYSSYVHI